jgi:hypothetical protein
MRAMTCADCLQEFLPDDSKILHYPLVPSCDCSQRAKRRDSSCDAARKRPTVLLATAFISALGLFETSSYRPPSFLYAIPRRLNTGTLAKSTTNAKIAAARSVPPTTNIDRGLIAMPRLTNVEMIKISQTVDTTTQ